jgi:hypothetical protein
VFEWLCCVCSQTRLGPGPRQQGRQVQEEGFPTLGTERSAEWRGVAQRRSAQAKRGRLGCLLSRARDGVPQQAWFPWLCAERMSALGGGHCGKERPAEEGVGRRQRDRRLEAGRKHRSLYLVDLLSLLLFFKRLSKSETGQNGRGTHQGHITRARGAPICVFRGDFDNILITIPGGAKAGSAFRKGPMQ